MAAATAIRWTGRRDKVLEDVLGAYCSADHARTVYGVAIGLDAETGDPAATEKLRGDAQAEKGPRKAVPCASKARCGWPAQWSPLTRPT
ncbi:hypothetical protein [Paracoccus versutus]|uniref:hypothetical protein n=1 Tax=Paracoccus versutus TaxID=34007 RepID=UPI000DF77EFB|nr:hypothetical protein [Paracoccus versutus]RDD69444.1 hypothetical protein DVR11_21820 [Paracoccus versutus]